MDTSSTVQCTIATTDAMTRAPTPMQYQLSCPRPEGNTPEDKACQSAYDELRQSRERRNEETYDPRLVNAFNKILKFRETKQAQRIRDSWARAGLLPKEFIMDNMSIGDN